MKEKYINPFTDFGFKKIFGEELNKDLLIDFLNELLKGEQHIRDLTYKNTENLGKSVLDRKAIFDLYCENDKNEKIIVELQKTKQKFFKDRSIYYSTFPIVEQAELGEWDFQLKAVYTVAILDFTFEDEDQDKTVVTHVQLLNTFTKKVFYEKLTFIYLQMPNFNKSEDQLDNRFDKWLYIFKNLPKLQNRPQKLQERVFEKLFAVAEIAKFTSDEKSAYENSLKYYRDMKNSFDTAREEGREEGREEQMAGFIERLDKLGMDEVFISKATGLSIEDVKNILRGIKNKK
jgi:predicted transposase/invertase (TIGR01784 family)